MKILVYILIATASVMMTRQVTKTPNIAVRFVGGSTKLGTTPGGGARAGMSRFAPGKFARVTMVAIERQIEMVILRSVQMRFEHCYVGSERSG
jgi:hypothetical protein